MRRCIGRFRLPVFLGDRTGATKAKNGIQIYPGLGLIYEGKGVHTLCTFGADKPQAILSETPTVVDIFAVYARHSWRLQICASFSGNSVTTADVARMRSSLGFEVSFSTRTTKRNTQSRHATRRSKSECSRHHKALN